MAQKLDSTFVPVHGGFDPTDGATSASNRGGRMGCQQRGKWLQMDLHVLMVAFETSVAKAGKMEFCFRFAAGTTMSMASQEG